MLAIGFLVGLMLGTRIEHNNRACLEHRLRDLRAKPMDEAERQKVPTALDGLHGSGPERLTPEEAVRVQAALDAWEARGPFRTHGTPRHQVRRLVDGMIYPAAMDDARVMPGIPSAGTTIGSQPSGSLTEAPCHQHGVLINVRGWCPDCKEWV